MITYVLQDEVRAQPLDMYVTGPYRHQYFKRPIIPLLQPNPPEIIMQLPAEQKLDDHLEEEKSVEPTRTIAIQTMYRESDTQTDPYSPEYVVKAGSNPEVLQIHMFTYGNGLPASMAEMELIEQARKKRLFEAMLPSSTDEACFARRQKLMEEQEFKEWNKREQDIKHIQDERLQLLQTALFDREKENEERTAQRIEEIRLKKTEHKDRALAKIGRKRIKLLRKMFKERKRNDQISIHRDIIEEYANFGSEVYAPITRKGLSLDKLSNKYEVQPEALTTYSGLRELTDTLPEAVLKTTIDIKAELKRSMKKSTRKEIQHKSALDKARVAIESLKTKPGKSSDRKDAGDGRTSATDDFFRPDTPKVDERQKETADDRENALILLQRMLRGRAVQNYMFEGKEKRLDLIAELRRTGEIAQLSDNEQEKALIEAYRERIMDSMADGVQGSLISEALDSLSKELVRLKQEQRISFMVRLAEERRRKQESEESGRRQAEEVLRAREDSLYREVVTTNQTTVDSYLTHLFTNAVRDASQQQALDEAYLRAYQINRLMDNIETRMNRPEVIVRDLVHSFLIPEIDRRRLRRGIALEEKRHLFTARKMIEEAAKRAKHDLSIVSEERPEATD